MTSTIRKADELESQSLDKVATEFNIIYHQISEGNYPHQ
jgi:hypothetical protein